MTRVDIAPAVWALRGVKILFAQHYAIDELVGGANEKKAALRLRPNLDCAQLLVWDALFSTRDALLYKFPLVEYLVRRR